MAGRELLPSRDELRRYFEVDLRSLAVLRIALGAIVLVDLATRLGLVGLFYTDGGVWPRQLARTTMPWPGLSLHMLGGESGFQLLLLALHAALALLLLVGLYTRFASIGVWLLSVSLLLRNPLLLDAGDHLLVLLLFWGMLTPLGARYSLDAWLRGESGRKSQRLLSIASAGLLLQIAFVYFFSALIKLYGDTWQDGTAVFYALGHELWVRPLGLWIRQHPLLVHALTYGTVALELVGPLLLFSPVRTREARIVALSGFTLFQLGLAVSLELWLFPWIATAALIPFIPRDIWDRLERRFARGAPTGDSARAPQEAVESGRAAPAGGTARARRALNLAGEIVAAVALAYVLMANIEIWRVRQLLPSAVEDVAGSLGLGQGWIMYAPDPYVYNFRLIVTGTVQGGGRVIIHDRKANVEWPPMERFYRSYRTKAYLERVADPSRPGELVGLARWICRRWDGPGELVEAELTLEETPIAAGGRQGTRTRTTPLAEHHCWRKEGSG